MKWDSPVWLCSESESSNVAQSIVLLDLNTLDLTQPRFPLEEIESPVLSPVGRVKLNTCSAISWGETGILTWETGQMAVFGSIQAMFKGKVIFLFYIYTEVHKYELRKWLHSAWNRVKKNPETHEGSSEVWDLDASWGALVAVLPLLSTVCGSCPW